MKKADLTGEVKEMYTKYGPGSSHHGRERYLVLGVAEVGKREILTNKVARGFRIRQNELTKGPNRPSSQ